MSELEKIEENLKDIFDDDNDELTKHVHNLLSILETPYDRIIYHIQDPEILKIFKELTLPIKDNINNHASDILKIFSKHKFSELNFEGYLRIAFWSEPCCWILYLKDEDFLNFLESHWKDIIELYQSCQNSLQESEEEIKSEFDNLDEEIANELVELNDDSFERRSPLLAINVIKIFCEKYPDRFKIV